MRIIFVLLLLSLSAGAYAQFVIPPYSIVKDSATHITVIHSGNAEKIKIFDRKDTDAMSFISPDIRILNGVVEHRGLTGEIFVREYYVDSMLIGYIEFDGLNMRREIYYNHSGNVFLEKRYQNGVLVSVDDKIQTGRH